MGRLGHLSPQGSVAVGIIVGLISTSLQAIGLTLQRKSHILEDEKNPYELRRPPYKRRRWQLGMSMFVVSNIVGSTIQITTLPLPVLSTLQASGLVFNTIFATLILGESFTRYSLIGTILVCIGAILIATFGAIGEPAHTLDQLLELLQRRPFVLWMIGTGLIAAVILVLSRLLKFLSPWSRSKHLHFLGPYAPRLQIVQSRVRLLRGMCYGLVSGILSAHCLLLAKSAVELIVRTIVDRVNQFNRWQSWMILIGMILLALIQLYYLHRGLKLCSTSVLYPFVFCIYNIIAILDGLIYFRQVSQVAGLHAGLIAFGTIILLSGVLCLSWRLEDIETHAPVTAQTGLGPGMAIVEEHPPDAETRMELDEEEAQVGEREPLLHHATLPRLDQRAPSLPQFTPFAQRNSTADVDPASIWAELDDSDPDNTAGSDSRSPLLFPRRRRRLSLEPFRTRSRSISGPGVFTSTWRGHRTTSNPNTTTRSPLSRRHPPPVQETRWRRNTLAGMVGGGGGPQKRRSFWYGTLGDNNNPTTTHHNTHSDPPLSPRPGAATAEHGIERHSSAGPLTASRDVVTNAWRSGLGYVSRWTGRLGSSAHPPPTHSDGPIQEPQRQRQRQQQQQQSLLHDQNREV